MEEKLEENSSHKRPVIEEVEFSAEETVEKSPSFEEKDIKQQPQEPQIEKEEKGVIPEAVEEQRPVEQPEKIMDTEGDKIFQENSSIAALMRLAEEKDELLQKKKGQQGLLNGIKRRLGIKKPEESAQIDEEYRDVYNKYQEALEKLSGLTGKSVDQIKEDYLNKKEKEGSVDAVNNKLDAAEKNLEAQEQLQKGEKISLYNKAADWAKRHPKTMLCVKAALVGGMIAIPVGGVVAASAGLGLGQVVFHMGILPAVWGDLAGVGMGVAGGGLLSKYLREAKELDEAESLQKENKENDSPEGSAENKKDNPQAAPDRETPALEKDKEEESASIKRPGGALVAKPVEIDGVFYDSEHLPQEYVGDNGKKEYRGGKKISEAEAYSMMFWNENRSETAKEKMKKIIEDASKTGILSISVSKLKENKSGTFDLEQKDKEFISAYMILARDMGYSLQSFNYDKDTQKIEAVITKINK